CHGEPLVLTSQSDQLTSPRFGEGQSYRNNLLCEWILLGDPGEVFRISFNSFMLEQSPTCQFDSLTIVDVFDFEELLNDNDTNTDTNVGYTNNTDTNVGYTNNTDTNYSFPPVRCGEEEFRCGIEKCIDWSKVCDHTEDCADGSDEMICPSSRECGLPAILPIESRVVGGREAIRGAWPWTVSVLDSHRQTHMCGAALVAPQWAISAAHCFTREYNRDYTGYSVRAGRHDLKIADRNEQTVRIAEVISRRDYVEQWSLNDLALIRFKDPLVLTDYVRPVCLPSAPVTAGSQCYLTGWGETLNSCCPDVLKQALLPVINNTVCAGANYYGTRFREHMFCAGYPDGGTDACSGDSGGPLVCPADSSTDDQGPRHWEVQGVTSWGLLCGAAQKPGVYTAVHDYIRWIQQTIALHSQ
ncbi:hypothetical protein EGW08_003016, partial [Elysia chlorotica]